MKTEKKSYATPELTRHGTVAELTQHGGGGYYDTPSGTPAASVATGSQP
jgi:hypothetical protein